MSFSTLNKCTCPNCGKKIFIEIEVPSTNVLEIMTAEQALVAVEKTHADESEESKKESIDWINSDKD